MNTSAANALSSDSFFDITHTRTHYIATTLLRVIGPGNETSRQHVTHEIERLPGIVSASFIRKKPAMLLIEYEPGQVQAVQLLQAIRRSGNDARRVC